MLCILIASTSWSQIKFSLKQMPDGSSWGVYVKTCNSVSPSGNTITGSGQVTIVLPMGNDIRGIVNHAGLWNENATVSGPDEEPNKNYVSVGFISDSPQILHSTTEETLLFSFGTTGNAPGDPQLIENGADPFTVFPNSVHSNPGNEMSVLDIGVSPVGYYNYEGNYVDDAGCPTVVDTTVIDVPDTTGNENPTSTLDQLNQEKYFTLSPNPTSEWITINFAGAWSEGKGNVNLWTATGISIGRLEQNGQGKMTFNVGALPNGMYFVSYETDGKVMQQERFMKQ